MLGVFELLLPDIAREASDRDVPGFLKCAPEGRMLQPLGAEPKRYRAKIFNVLDEKLNWFVI